MIRQVFTDLFATRLQYYPIVALVTYRRVNMRPIRQFQSLNNQLSLNIFNQLLSLLHLLLVCLAHFIVLGHELLTLSIILDLYERLSHLCVLVPLVSQLLKLVLERAMVLIVAQDCINVGIVGLSVDDVLSN